MSSQIRTSVGVQPLKRSRQGEIAFGGQEFLDESEGRSEEHRVPALYEGVPEGSGRMRLAATRQTEAKDVLSALDEVAGGELVELRHDLAREAGAVERLECLPRWKPRGAKKALGFALTALVGLGFEDLEKHGQRVSVAGSEKRRTTSAANVGSLKRVRSSPMRACMSTVSSVMTHRPRGDGHKR
jgi:hypothetical protein